MRTIVQSQWLLAVGALVPAAFAFLPSAVGSPNSGGDGKVDYQREVRPILAQHCFQCHGPDEAARKGKLRLDLKGDAFAERKGKHVIEGGNLEGSLVWERIVTDNEKKKMPPEGKAEPLTEKKIATIKAWIEQGATWQEHWSFVPPTRPTIPSVSDKEWVRDPMDAFVLARIEKEGLKPEAEAAREAWLRRASFDLTGLPPTPAELDEFLKDKSPDAYDKQVDRLLASPRYGERQAQEWLDLSRYADTSGYQNDTPRKIWKWREWVINAYNANMPFDQFTIEQLAGDLLPNATVAQKTATGFNRNHPTNSEAGEEEDEYRSAYVIDRVNTTSTVFMGLTLACVQCHDHKYDPLSQRDYYQFYSFFNNINERDSDFRNPRPSMPVPNPDQEPKLADIKARIEAVKKRLDRDDPLADAAQAEWEKKILESLGDSISWTTPEPAGMLARNGSILKRLDDGSILSTGAAPVKDTYDVMIQPGKKRITALRLEVLPDDSQPLKALGRATDGRFIMTAIEIRNSTLSESQEPPLVYVSRADSDLNQKPKEDPASYDMMPGGIESAIVVEPIGGAGDPEGLANRGFRGGWSIVDDERKKPHEALFLPLEPLETNEASVLRVSMHHTATSKFKSLIGRFRISYTEDDRVRQLLLPAQTKLWSSIGPFPAEDVVKAYETAFEPEKDITKGSLDLKKSYEKVVLASEQDKGGDGGGPGGKGPGGAGPGGKAPEGAAEKKSAEGEKATKSEKPEKADAVAKDEKPEAKPEEKSEPKAEKATKSDEEPTAPKAAVADAKPAEAAPEGGAKPDAEGEKAFPKKGGFAGGPKKGFGGGKFGKKPEGDAPAGEGEVAKAASAKPSATEGGEGSAVAAKSDAPKSENSQKPGPSEEGAVGPDGPKKPTKDVAKADAPKPAKPDASEKSPAKDGEGEKAKRKPEKITWTEQGKWRDGMSARLDGSNSAYYITRKIHSTRARTAMVKLDGVAGFKMWLNGEPVQASQPTPPPAPPAMAKGGPGAVAKPGAAEKGDGEKPKEDDKSKEKKDNKSDDDEEDAGPAFDPDEFDMFGRAPSKTEKKFRLGLRQGENELTVKVVLGGGGGMGGRRGGFEGVDFAMGGFGGGRRGGGGSSFTFELVPEGDDVINHEVATALRLEAAERAGASAAPAAPATSPDAQPPAGAAPSPAAPAAAPAANAPPAGAVGSSGKSGPNARGVDASMANSGAPADEPKPSGESQESAKVSLVGEKAAPLATGEEANLLTPSERRKKALREYYRSKIDPIGRVLAEELDKLKDEERQIKREIPESLVMEEREKNPRKAYVFKRGLYKNKGDEVESGTPAVLPPMAKDLPRNRLGLAKWLVSGEHPLTARVLVNRIWQQYFGIGIVRTAEDFGIRAELPTHPELLDYLAMELVENKWDLKKLHRRIVLSATYRQSSVISKEKLERDPENRLLARGPRLRLSSEMIRDNALATSGLLFEKIGGESVKPYQPKNAWKTVEGNMSSSYRRDRDEKQYRRGLYVFWKRGSPYPSMLNFDSGKRDACLVTRAYTTTPLQALTLLNDPVFVEAAKMLGQRMLKDKEAIGRAKDLTKDAEDEKRLQYGFRLCTSRAATEKELGILKKLLASQREHYKADAEAAKKLLSVGDAKVDEKLDAAEAAAWASVGNALLNLDATIHRG